jgi:VanZ family protein
VVRLKHYAPIALGLGILLVAAFPFSSLTNHAHWDKVRWVPFVSPPIKGHDIIGNVLLGMPAGVAIAAKTLGGPAAVAITVGTVSLICEGAQIYSHHRFPSVTDFICNVGGAVGAALWWGSRKKAQALASSAIRGPRL